MAQQDNINVNGLSLPVWAMQSTAQQIDDAVSAVLEWQEDPNNTGCYYHMVDGVQEWLNPPMVLGVEYRTTERNNKKPVYKKIVSIGNLPNTSTISVSHNSENVLAAISGDLYNQDGTLLNVYNLIAQFTVGRKSIVVRTSGDMSSNICTVPMKYTKTTD